MSGVVAGAAGLVGLAVGLLVNRAAGRAPWPADVAAMLGDLATGYLLLELDRANGRRGARYRASRGKNCSRGTA